MQRVCAAHGGPLVEERDLAERLSGPEHPEHLLLPVAVGPVRPHHPLHHQVQPAARLALAEEPLPPADAAADRALHQGVALRLRERREERLPGDYARRIVAASTDHQVPPP